MQETIATYAKRGAFLAALALFGWYVYAQSADIISGPRLTVSTPQNGVSFTTPDIVVEGSVANISFLSLNGRQIFADPEGAFAEKLLLLPGYNIMTLTATDRFGRTRTVERTLIYR